MQAELNIKRVEDCMEWLEANADKYEEKQSIDLLITDLGALVKAMAFVNGQMAVAKRNWNRKKTEAYHSWLVSSKSQDKDLPVSLIKDYISSRCEKEQYEYDLCERCSRTIYHTCEMLRSIISALKEEARLTNWAGQNGAIV